MIFLSSVYVVVGWVQLLVDFAGSDVRVERVSRDCFKDGGALAEVLDFYSVKDDHENTAVIKAEEKIAENGLEVRLLPLDKS